MRVHPLAALHFLVCTSLGADAFVIPRGQTSLTNTASALFVTNLERENVKITKNNFNGDDDDEDEDDDLYSTTSKIPSKLRVAGKGVPNRRDKIQLVDTSTYEAKLLETWDNDPTRQTGFDWEIEKMRRYAAGLRMRDDGAWVKQPSALEFLVSKQRVQNLSDGPSPVNAKDVAILFAVNILSYFGLGSAFGMAAVPTAEIEKYEGSFFFFH